MIGNPQAISAFWQAFQDNKGALAAASSADDAVYDLLLDRLQQVHPDLYFEFSSDPGSSEIVITAEGDTSLFPLVESIVATAPEIAGWSVVPLKPKLGFPVEATWEDFTVTIAHVLFEPLEREGSEELGIRMFIIGLAPESTEDAHNALLRALDHALGERQFAESVQHTEVHPLPADATGDDYLRLTDLENYIRWRKKKREHRNCQQGAPPNAGNATQLGNSEASEEPPSVS
jgi:hypothetical protein